MINESIQMIQISVGVCENVCHVFSVGMRQTRSLHNIKWSRNSGLIGTLQINQIKPTTFAVACRYLLVSVFNIDSGCSVGPKANIVKQQCRRICEIRHDVARLAALKCTEISLTRAHNQWSYSKCCETVCLVSDKQMRIVQRIPKIRRGPFTQKDASTCQLS